jgi:hypothetical protein
MTLPYGAVTRKSGSGITVRPLHPKLGAEISGIDLSALLKPLN